MARLRCPLAGNSPENSCSGTQLAQHTWCNVGLKPSWWTHWQSNPHLLNWWMSQAGEWDGKDPRLKGWGWAAGCWPPGEWWPGTRETLGPAGLPSSCTQALFFGGEGAAGRCCLTFLSFHDPKLSHHTLSSLCYIGKHSDGFSCSYDTMPQW